MALIKACHPAKARILAIWRQPTYLAAPPVSVWFRTRMPAVCSIEPDPTYEFSATPAAAGGVRRLMSKPENIQTSQFSLDFYAAFTRELEMDIDIACKRQGYLFLVDTEGVAELEQNFETRQGLGADAALLDVAALQRLFPSIGTDRVALTCHSPKQLPMSEIILDLPAQALPTSRGFDSTIGEPNRNLNKGGKGVEPGGQFIFSSNSLRSR